MAEIHRTILRTWKADSWAHAGHNEEGVCKYTLYCQGEPLVTDTLVNLKITGVDQEKSETL